MIGKLDHFNLIAEAAGGGPWRAYLARDTVHGRTVLIKVAPAELAEPGARRERFLTAARQAASLSHPNLATVFDVGDSGDAPYLAIEFVPGETLAQVMAAGPQHVRAAVDLGIQLADALAEVHAHGLVHGDVRTETIRVSPKGNAKLLEAGLSAWTRGGRLRHPAAARAEADATVALDTVAYFSPEQARGDAVDERSDLFSLGAVLYEMLTGVTAFRRGSVESTLASVLDTRPREPSEIDPSIPEDLDAVVRRALAKALEERFQSAASFAAEATQRGRDPRHSQWLQRTTGRRRAEARRMAGGRSPRGRRDDGRRHWYRTGLVAGRRCPPSTGPPMARAAAGRDRDGVAARVRRRRLAILRRWAERRSRGSNRSAAGSVGGRPAPV